MRILGFQRKWDKLNRTYPYVAYELALSDEEASSAVFFTTFRYPRLDKDWQVGELVQVVIKPRSKERKFVYYAEIIKIEPIAMSDIIAQMAWADGFSSLGAMMDWLANTYGNDYRWLWRKPMNRIFLRQRKRL